MGDYWLADSKITQKQLDEAYALYPRKMGRSPGMRALRGRVRTEEDLANLKLAIMNYIVYLKKSATEAQYIMYFDTFARQFADWSDPNHGAVTIEKDKVDLSEVGFE